MSPIFFCFLLSRLLSAVVGMPLMSLVEIGDDFDETIGNFLATGVDSVRRVRRYPEEMENFEADEPLKRVQREANGENFPDFPPPGGCPEMRSARADTWPASAGASPWPTYGPDPRSIDGLVGIGQEISGIGQGIGGIGYGIGGIGHGSERIASPIIEEPIVYMTTIPYISGYKMTPIISEKHVIVKEASGGGARSAESAPSVEIWSPTGARSSDFQIDNPPPPHPLDLNIFFAHRSAEDPDECEQEGRSHTEAEFRGADVHTELDGIPYTEAISRLQQRIQHLQSLQLARERLNRSDFENYV